MGVARWVTGVAVGSFNPPHAGHVDLVAAALEQTRQLHVLVRERADQSISGADRAAWLADAVDVQPGRLVVHITPDDLPDEPEPWAERALAVLPTAPEVAFTDAADGLAWASAMGAAHVVVDPKPGAQPISAAALRGDLAGSFDHLVPAARASLCRRVVLAGAESTGKTTLAAQLARELGTAWVPEHRRLYVEGRRTLPDASAWASWELATIARTQQRLIQDMARLSRRGWLIADTDALATAVWHRRQLGRRSPVVEHLAAMSRPDLYVVCAPDLPWTDDGARGSAAERAAMHLDTLDLLEASGVPFVVVVGHGDERLEAARAALPLAGDLPVLR